MKYALIVLDVPKMDGSTLAVLSKVSEEFVLTKEKTRRAYMLNVGAFLLPLDSDLGELADLVVVLRDRRIPYRTLFLDDPTFISHVV